ncbi:hypothetical protein FRB94_000543 [Tulasnella sp. JGI-2019a]|nr:hypothetical protein FRB94_000543 [Tulasnella sp. JGI-2019a]KAG9016137.1 hypothetical protein FRB93_011611 [Tulasnella sp. JGI-2019a]
MPGMNGRNVTDYAARISSYAGRQSIGRLQREVTLESILAGTTCSPISLQDFELYLAYRELSLENLQFVVWYLDYRDRFSKLPAEVRLQSPDPAIIVPGFATSLPVEPTIPETRSPWRTWFSRLRHKSLSDLESLERGRDRRRHSTGSYPFPAISSRQASPARRASASYLTQPMSPLSPDESGSGRNTMRESKTLCTNPRLEPPTDSLTEEVSPKKQPLREETLRVVATFLRPGGVTQKELTLEDETREAIFRNLALTTHPNVFREAYNQVYAQLDASARNFIATQTTNINLPKQIVRYTIWLIMTVLSILLAGLTIVKVPVHHPHHHPMLRAVRLVATPFAFFGSISFYTAWRGFCSQIYGRSRMQLKAWEMEDPSEVGVKMRKTRTGREKTRSQRRAREQAAVSDGTGEEDDKKGRTIDEDAKHIELVQELDISSYHQNIPNDATIIAPFTLSRSPSSLDFHGEISPDDERGYTTVNESWSAQRKSVTIDVSSARATLDQRRQAAPGAGNEPTHEIVFTRPKRTAMVDMGYQRPPVFGPERVVVDERIRKYHEEVLTNVVWAAVIYTSIFTAVVLSIPGPCKA